MIADAGQRGPVVVMVDEEFPWPPNSGKRIRTLSLVERLAPRFEIIYVARCNADADESSQARKRLESMGVRTIEVLHRVQPKKGLRFYARLTANLFSRLPYTVASHASPAMRQVLEHLRRESPVALWHCEWTPYAELFRHFDAAPLVISAHNVESMIWRRYGEHDRSPLRRRFFRSQMKRFERFERWAFSRADQTVFVSGEDEALARTSFGATRTAVVPNGVDSARYESSTGERRPAELIFVGSLDWRPNLDGIGEFLETSFPRIVAEEPSARLTIVGRNPPVWLTDRVRNSSTIQLHANVPDVVPYLSKAGVMVVPLRIGGGSRLKIIEAAANRLPVVSTRMGAEGLNFREGRDYLAADSIEAMTGPVLCAIRDQRTRESIAASARQIARNEYDWDLLAGRQAEIWQQLIDTGNGARS